MRNRSSSKGMGEKEEQPHLSGAYIRNLVKQLSNSSRAKGGDGSTMSSPNPENGETPKDNNTNTSDHKNKKASHDHASEENKAPMPHKKQVRRRLHTTRPYQERLLNMAEARREIVTALKIHRETMKQAKEKQQQQHHQQHMQLQQQQLQVPTLTAPSVPLFEPYQEYPLNYSNISNYLHNTNNSPFSYPSLSWSWSQSTIGPVTSVLDNYNLDLPLPSQPLGLNLNFQGFNGIKNSFSSNQSKPPTQPSSTTSSNSQSFSSPTPQIYEAPELHQHQNNVVSLHPMMDEEEMAAIYSIAEKHDIEWNDTVNLVTSAWWSKFLKTLEGGEGESKLEVTERKGSNNYVLDEALNAPTCFDDAFAQEVNAPSSSTFEEQLFAYYQADRMEGADLPQLDIEELEGWDAEWFS